MCVGFYLLVKYTKINHACLSQKKDILAETRIRICGKLIFSIQTYKIR